MIAPGSHKKVAITRSVFISPRGKNNKNYPCQITLIDHYFQGPLYPIDRAALDAEVVPAAVAVVAGAADAEDDLVVAVAQEVDAVGGEGPVAVAHGRQGGRVAKLAVAAFSLI